MLKSVCYEDNEGLHDLPRWAKFYSRLGALVSKQLNNEKRLIVALTVPTRAYVAAFLATGVVIAKALEPADENISSPRAHFEGLASLPEGTPLTYRSNGLVYRALLIGKEKRNNVDYLVIKLHNDRGGGLRRLVPINLCLNISVAEGGRISLPMTQPGLQVIPEEGFLEAVIPGVETAEFVSGSRMDCLIIGRINYLRREIKKTPLIINTATGQVSGALQDILRARRFYGEGVPFRSDIIPITEDLSSQPSIKTQPSVTIFDGAVSFIEHRYRWVSSNWVVILDRTEEELSEAAAEVNSDYRRNRACADENSCDLLSNMGFDVKRLPVGIEIMVYEVAKR